MRTSFDQVTDLESVFGAMPGEDRVLISWEEMCDWLDQISAVSPYLSMENIGSSTEGRDIRLVIASSPATLSNLDEAIQQRQNLKDRRSYEPGADPKSLASGAKPVVLVTAGIHATEVGGVQMMPAFIRDLATEPKYHEILENIILLVVPTLNPDGMDLVQDWYDRTVGTPAEGTNPPRLYHRYAGHDNNRDWYQRRLVETQVVLDAVHRVWFSHVVIDLHQMGKHAPRYVVPPYIDPVEPNVHPLVFSLAAELGSKIAADHARAGNAGVCSGVMFDCYSPSRAYMHYHGGVRILAEAASAGIASPVHVAEQELLPFDSSESNGPSVHLPLPWRGGSWHLGDIIRLHRQTIDSVLESVSANAGRWITDQWKMLSDQVNKVDAGTVVIPPLRQQVDAAAARELIELLCAGDVEVFVADENTEDVQKGSFVIPLQQPFGSYAAALLTLVPYPQGGSGYDVTSHCLPVHMGVDAKAFASYGGSIREISADDLTPFQPAKAVDVQVGAWLAIDARSHASIQLVNHALRTGSRVLRLQKPHFFNNRVLLAGSWLIADTSAWDIMAHASKLHIRTSVISPISANTAPVQPVRLGLYDPQHDSANDYGWLTYWLEKAGFPFEVVTGETIVHGQLKEIDTLLVPHLKPEQLVRQYAGQPYPVEFTRGLSDRVSSALKTWLHRGGHLVGFEGAVAALAKQTGIEIAQPMVRRSRSTFNSTGTVVKVHPNPGDELTAGIDEPFPAMYFSPYGYHVQDSGRQHSIAKFAHDGLVVSGGMKGEKELAGLHAVIQMTIGEGHFTAFAFRPHFRTQMLASEQLLVNVIMQDFRRGSIHP